MMQIGHSLEHFLPSGATLMVLGAMLQPINLCVLVKGEIYISGVGWDSVHIIHLWYHLIQ